jgi:hypothetical protein
MKVMVQAEINGADFIDDLKSSCRITGESLHMQAHTFIMEVDAGMADYDFTATLVKSLLALLAEEHTKESPMNMADFAPAKLHGD